MARGARTHGSVLRKSGKYRTCSERVRMYRKTQGLENDCFLCFAHSFVKELKMRNLEVRFLRVTCGKRYGRYLVQWEPRLPGAINAARGIRARAARCGDRNAWLVHTPPYITLLPPRQVYCMGTQIRRCKASGRQAARMGSAALHVAIEMKEAR